MKYSWRDIGSNVSSAGVGFRVWAPFASRVDLVLQDSAIPMTGEDDYFYAIIRDCSPGDIYRYSVDGRKLPDPASRFQPRGIRGGSQVIDLESYKWRNTEWKGIPLEDMIIYEVHTGAFTESGNYSGIKSKIGHLHSLGVNTLELMPVNQTYGSRNWGYDGVFPYAPMYSYGHPDHLKDLVDELHGSGFAVILDVVYNHLGPLGNVLPFYGPYLSEKYTSPWGASLNFDSGYSNPVRDFFIGNALYWLDGFRFDGLRLDATHSIVDQTPRHFLEDLSMEVEKLSGSTGRKIVLVAENDRNDTGIVRERKRCGMGMDGIWSDDLHHAIHSYLTGENDGYYSDYGTSDPIFKGLRDGFVYDGVYSKHLKMIRGTRFSGEFPWKLIVSLQNHDQVGNRPLGSRISSILSIDRLKLGVATILLSPYTPLLFMGEEYAEKSPFLFFSDPPDSDFAEKVDRGRKEEFRNFEKVHRMPDPSSPDAFLNSRLSWDMTETHSKILDFYRETIRIRKKYLTPVARSKFRVLNSGGTFLILYPFGDATVQVTLNYTGDEMDLDGEVLLNSSVQRFGGTNKEPDRINEFGSVVTLLQRGERS